MWKPFRTAAGLGTPQAQRTSAIDHKSEVSASRRTLLFKYLDFAQSARGHVENGAAHG
jgi:hypothetical protein